MQIQGEAQGTYFSVIYYDANARDFSAAIDSLLAAYDQSVSSWEQSSVISRVNRNEISEINDPIFIGNFKLAQKISKQTGGAFDVTVGPLVNAWGFGFKEGIEIDQHKVDSLLQFTGYQRIRLANNKVLKEDERIQVDFNAIAQGYSVDMVSNFLESKGIESYLVDIGGEVYCKGLKPGEEKWVVEVEKPAQNADDERTAIVTLNVSDMAIATSGSYRKYYIRNGIKHSHTINPATGYPVRHSLLSATVIAPTCAEADAYATALMVMGLEDGQVFLDNHPELECLLIYADSSGNMEMWQTDGIPAYLEK